jgi:peptidyl-tRNA hydrolase
MDAKAFELYVFCYLCPHLLIRAHHGLDHPTSAALVSNADSWYLATGKIAAQCSHATLACYKTLVRADPSHPVLKRWERLGQAKVALKIDSEDDMLMLQAQAISLGLCAQVIHDAGRTQIASGSATVLGIGPAPKSKINEVTGHLKLLWAIEGAAGAEVLVIGRLNEELSLMQTSA